MQLWYRYGMATQRKPKSPATVAPAPSRSTAPKKSVSMPQLPTGLPTLRRGKATTVKSTLAFQGKIFSVYTDEVQEPNGVHATRDVVRHNGSIVILAVDEETNPRDPLLVIEQQFRQAAGQYLYELPAGRVEPGENTLAAAKRELIEETGFRAKKWSKLVRYFASPGFVAEWMEIYLATGIVAGEAQPEEDEKIDVRLVPLSQMVELCLAGKINDGKTLIGVMLYAEQRRLAQKAAKAKPVEVAGGHCRA